MVGEVSRLFTSLKDVFMPDLTTLESDRSLDVTVTSSGADEFSVLAKGYKNSFEKDYCA